MEIGEESGTEGERERVLYFIPTGSYIQWVYITHIEGKQMWSGCQLVMRGKQLYHFIQERTHVFHTCCVFCPKNWHDRSKWVAIREVSDKIGYLNSLGTKQVNGDKRKKNEKQEGQIYIKTLGPRDGHGTGSYYLHPRPDPQHGFVFVLHPNSKWERGSLRGFGDPNIFEKRIDQCYSSISTNRSTKL